MLKESTQDSRRCSEEVRSSLRDVRTITRKKQVTGPCEHSRTLETRAGSVKTLQVIWHVHNHNSSLITGWDPTKTLPCAQTIQWNQQALGPGNYTDWITSTCLNLVNFLTLARFIGTTKHAEPKKVFFRQIQTQTWPASLHEDLRALKRLVIRWICNSTSYGPGRRWNIGTGYGPGRTWECCNRLWAESMLEYCNKLCASNCIDVAVKNGHNLV